MILRRLIAGVIFAFLVTFAPAQAAEQASNTSPFLFSPSTLAPTPSRGWVALLPGEDELAFKTNSAHYGKIAALLNANGFDTLIVPYEEAYDEDVDGEPDTDGERIAAVTARAVQWMHQAHPSTEGDPGAIIAWGEGSQGLWQIVATGSRYPLPALVGAIVVHPGAGPDLGFDSRVPLLLQVGQLDEELHTLRHVAFAEGTVEPEFAIYDDAHRGFDVERFAKPKTVRSTPLIGARLTFAYNAAAAHLAQQKMLTFLKARLEAPE